MYFLVVIDRESVLVEIFRELCDVMFGVLSSPLHSERKNKMRPHWDLQNVSKSWLLFQFVVFLCGVHTLTCIPGPVHLWMSRRVCI